MEEPTRDPIQRNERLRVHRIQHNWRQQDIADQLGIAVITVRRWERGSQQPSAYYRVKLCDLFGVNAQELGFIDTPSSSPSIPPESEVTEGIAPSAALPPSVASSSEEMPLWTIPYGRNPHFTGRDELLAHLEQQFSPEGPDQPRTLHHAALTQSQAIKGLGGIGKTQIAVEYAYRARLQGRYMHTLWINAASEEAIQTSFTSLADQLPAVLSQNQTDQHKLVAAIIRWLERCEQPWLLIMDNADDLSLIQPYLPRQGNGHILLTTRASAVSSLASPIEVDTMGVIEGSQLLLRRIQHLADASDEEINEAANLVMMLAQFPLALDQAGAYIEETGCSLRDYLQLYQEHRYALLARRGKQVSQHPDSVATTWSLSFERVEQANPAAAELLRLCALLAPDHIPEELLTEGAPYWPPALQQAVANRLTFNQMLETLLSFSLVKRLSEDRLLSIHRLVQVVQKERMSEEEQRQWVERLVHAVNVVFPQDPKNEVTSWPQCQRYLEQVHACTALVQQYQIVLSEATEVFDRAGIYLRECAMYSLTEPLFLQALAIQEQQVGPDHPRVAHILNNLALLYQKQGRYELAESLYQRALHIQEQQLEPEHLDLAALLHNLAALYWEQRRYEQAEQFDQKAIHIREQQLGPDHLDLAISLHNLATVYSEQEKYEQSEPLYHRALAIYEQQLGPDHPLVATSLCTLAFLYWKEGKYDQSELLYQRALAINERALGPDHPNTAYPLHGLGDLYTSQGKYEQAELFYQRALSIREQKLGPEHRDTAHVMHDFAGLLHTLGRTREARSMYQRALKIHEQVFGPDHSMTIETRERLYMVLAANKAI